MASAYSFGNFELRPDERALLADGEPVRLGGRAFDILLALVERRERLVDFDELLDVVWPGLAVEENNLSVQISSLRKVLGSAAITTVRGKGYRFTAPIRTVTADAAAVRAPLDARPSARAVVCLLGTEGAGTTSPDSLHAWQQQGGQWLGAECGPTARLLLFEALRPAALAALGTARSAVSGARIGMVAIDSCTGSACTALGSATKRATALAEAARPGDILLTADLVSELVPGVDGELEDLGEVDIAGIGVRIFRLHDAGGLTLGPKQRPRADTRPAIAVLPFDGPAPDDLLGEALADQAIAALSRLSGFAVISGLSSRRLRRCGLAHSGIAGILQADYLLCGNCRQSDGQVVLRLQLQDSHEGEVLCTIDLEALSGEAFAATNPLGQRIATRVAQALSAHAIALTRVRSIPELDNHALLTGAVGLMHRASRTEFERARAMLEHLTQRPGCKGVACAWLAKWHVLRAVQGWSPDASLDAKLALELVHRSLADDSRDALALAIGGLVHAYLLKDLRTAGALYDEAVDANPSEPLAWLFSATRLGYVGKGREAEAAADRALQLSPIDPLKYFFDSLAATAALANGNWARSEELCWRSLRGNRTHASTWRTLAFALVMLGRMDEARDAVQRLIGIEPGFTVSRFMDRFPGREGPMAAPWAEALKAAGLPA